MKKVIAIFIIVYVSLVGFNFSLDSASATIGQDIVGQHIVGQDTVGQDYKTFLPIITKNYPPSKSPFWIEIAAIHEIPASRMKTLQYMSDAEYKSFIAEAFPTLIEALVESGAGGTRIYVEWEDIEPTEPINGEPNYKWAWYDDRLDQIGDTGLDMVVTLGSIPSWAGDHNYGPIYPERLDEFIRFITDVVNRYKVPPYNVKYWELINEPDFSKVGYGGYGRHGDEYKDMLELAYPAIKAADPNAIVIKGGMAYDGFTWDSYGAWEGIVSTGMFYRLFPDEVIQAGGAPFFDALNLHYFPDYAPEWERWGPGNLPTCDYPESPGGTPYQAGGIDLIAKTSHYRNRMATCYGVNKPVWVTELAEHGYPDPLPGQSDLANQARYVIKGNVRGVAAGVEKIVWYALTTPNDVYEQQLLYDDWSPKPGFYAFKTLTSELRGYDYDRTLDFSNVEGYVFVNNSGSEKVVAWGSGSLTFPASQLRVVDRDGNVTIIQDGGSGDGDGGQNGSIRIQLPTNDEPVFIQKY